MGFLDLYSYLRHSDDSLSGFPAWASFSYLDTIMKNLRSMSSATGAAGLVLMLSACAVMPASGPSSRNVNNTPENAANGSAIEVMDVTSAVTRQIIAADHPVQFAQDLGEGRAIGSTIGKGDVLDIAIWEAPPAALFGAAGGDPRLTSSGSTARGTAMPEQMVDSDGRITIPFAGSLQAAGRTPQEISRDIVARLAGKAHQPQAIVRLLRNAAANVT
ncbi:MAG: polysaccharide biosynthesis/export family protein, partial [Novosphingobium sp.]|nr:polysaccharide biosynthesis/export family protein [Novosphingobium sp.]